MENLAAEMTKRVMWALRFMRCNGAGIVATLERDKDGNIAKIGLNEHWTKWFADALEMTGRYKIDRELLGLSKREARQDSEGAKTDSPEHRSCMSEECQNCLASPCQCAFADAVIAQSSVVRVHDLKCWPQYFDQIKSGEKTFEIRKNDRGFEIPCTLRLREYVPATDHNTTAYFTGRLMDCRVTYITDFDQKPGFVVMGISLGGVCIHETAIESVRLIIREAAAVLKGHAERMHEMADAEDWKSKTAAMLTMDHVKKLAWVHDLISPKD